MLRLYETFYQYQLNTNANSLICIIKEIQNIYYQTIKFLLENFTRAPPYLK